MTKNTKAQIAVILGNGIFGFSFLFSKLALQITIPSVLIAVRFLTAFIVLNGIVYTSSAFAGAIIAVIPIAGLILDVLIIHSKVSRRQILCAVASVLGVVITTLAAQDMESSALGLAMLMVAVIAGAMFYVFSKKSANDYNALERTYVMFGIGSAVYAVLALVQCYGNYDRYVVKAFQSATFWSAIIYLAVVSSVLAFLLLNYGSNYISVSQATLFANFTTVISIFAGVIVLKESFSLKQMIGAVIILVSVYFASDVHKEM